MYLKARLIALGRRRGGADEPRSRAGEARPRDTAGDDPRPTGGARHPLRHAPTNGSSNETVLVQEDRHGHRSISHARRDRHGYPSQRVELHDDTRRLRRVSTWSAGTGHAPARCRHVRPTSFLALGTGYGVDADWRHGMLRGTGPVVQRRRFDLAGAEPKGLHDNVARFTFDGQQGVGLLEYSIMGPTTHWGCGDRGPVASPDARRRVRQPECWP